jgi:hypothetical protein
VCINGQYVNKHIESVLCCTDIVIYQCMKAYRVVNVQFTSIFRNFTNLKQSLNMEHAECLKRIK